MIKDFQTIKPYNQTTIQRLKKTLYFPYGFTSMGMGMAWSFTQTLLKENGNQRWFFINKMIRYQTIIQLSKGRAYLE